MGDQRTQLGFKKKKKKKKRKSNLKSHKEDPSAHECIYEFIHNLKKACEQKIWGKYKAMDVIQKK